MTNRGVEASGAKKEKLPPNASQHIGGSRFDLIRAQLHDDSHPLGYAQTIRLATNLLVISDQITGRCRYPINSFDDLLAAFGSQNATIVTRGIATPLRYFKQFATSRFFPVQSEDDLIKKLISHIKSHRLAEEKGG